MLNVYETCPHYENDKYELKFVANEDCVDLLQVYSD